MTLWKGFLVKLRCRNFGCFMPCSRNAKTQLDLHEQKSGISHRYCILDLSCKSALIKWNILIGWTTFEAIIKQPLYQLNSIIKVQFTEKQKIQFTKTYMLLLFLQNTFIQLFSKQQQQQFSDVYQAKKSRTLCNIFLSYNTLALCEEQTKK